MNASCVCLFFIIFHSHHFQVFSIRTRAKNQLGTESWYQQVILQPESKGHWEKMPLRFPIQQWDTGKNGWRRERIRPLSLDLNCFWRKEWVLIIEEKHFVCFPSSEPLSAVQRLVLLTCPRTCVSFCLSPLFFCLNQPLCQKMSQQMKCSFLQENRFVAFSSIFVEIQKLWFSMEGIFLRDVIFF